MLGALVVFATASFSAVVAGLNRVNVPGIQQLYLDHAGTYTVYYEASGAPHLPAQPVHVAVIDPSGVEVPVRPLPILTFAGRHRARRK